jgi:hypothetical protein
MQRAASSPPTGVPAALAMNTVDTVCLRGSRDGSE